MFIDDGIEDNGLSVDGVSITVSPDPGVEVSYIGEDSKPDDTLTATSTRGLIGLFNADPGDYTLTVSGMPDGCRLDWGWGDTDEIRVPLRTNAISAVVVVCGQ